jgi:pyruvate,water dikinase
LGLDVKKSAMAVIIQEMIDGDRSGIVFGKGPTAEFETIIEAVYGLNQGLVDGTIEPDRWALSRKTGQEISHHSPLREKAMRPANGGIRMETLPTNLSDKPPLEKGELQQVYELSMKAEALFGSPQDLEWTFSDQRLYTLQARPITSHTQASSDERPCYLSLHRSFENLKDLRVKIEKNLLPSMEKEAMEWSNMDLSNQSNEALANEIERRIARYNDWLGRYREYCIPFAHGMRLFGQIYNDIIQPEEPHKKSNSSRACSADSRKSRHRVFLKTGSPSRLPTSIQKRVSFRYRHTRKSGRHKTAKGFFLCTKEACQPKGNQNRSFSN